MDIFSTHTAFAALKKDGGGFVPRVVHIDKLGLSKSWE